MSDSPAQLTDSGRLRRIKRIFESASVLTEEERRRLLDEECDGDASLRAQVELLLSCHTDGFLEEGHRRSLLGAEPVPECVGSFRVLRSLGRGGMGEVYLAIQERPHRRVALKILSRVRQGEKNARRFEREAEILAHLDHPSIARVFAADTHVTDEGVFPYFVMEFIDGVSLSEYRRATPSLDDRVRLLARICDAVDYAHGRGVLHCDLKPSNILVTRDGGPRVLDFGLARIVDEQIALAIDETSHGDLRGTLPYMSPEAIDGLPKLDRRSDIYSLGVVSYELLAGRRPFDLRGRGLAPFIESIRAGDCPPLGSVRRDCRGDLEGVVGRAMAAKREDRYANAAEIAADFRRVVAREVARPVTLPAPRRVAPSRRLRIAVVGAVLGLVLVAVLIAATSLVLRLRHHEAASALRRLGLSVVETGDGSGVAIDGDVSSLQFAQIAPHLAAMRGVRSLTLDGVRGSVDASRIVRLGDLRSLSLRSTELSDLASVSRLESLEELDLGFTAVSDISPLRRMTGLRVLNLESTSVEDISGLGSIRSLERIDLSETLVESVADLSSLGSLRELDIGRTRVTDVSPLASCPSLRRVDLHGTGVRDLSSIATRPGLEIIPPDSRRGRIIRPRDRERHATCLESIETLASGAEVRTYRTHWIDAAPELELSPFTDCFVEERRLLAADGRAGDRFGHDVATDGTLAVFGARGRGDSRGAVYVWARDGSGDWNEDGLLTPSDGSRGDEFGSVVDVHSGRVLVGAPERRHDETGATLSGAAYVFARRESGWVQESRLVPVEGTAGARYGFAASLRADTAAVGAVAKGDRGAVFVFRRSPAGAWSQEATIVPDRDVRAFGSSVALEGETIAIGAPLGGRELGSGSVWIHRREGETWRAVAVLTSGVERSNRRFGASVALSGDWLLVGETGTGSQPGMAWFYRRSGSAEWRLSTRIDFVGNETFGAVASLDRTLAVVAAGSGFAYLWRERDGRWTLDSGFLPADHCMLDTFGFAVDVEGETVVAGAPAHSHDTVGCGERHAPRRGAGYLFRTRFNLPGDAPGEN